MVYCLIFTIILLIGVRRYLTLYKTLINRTIIGLSIWLVLGIILRYFLSDPPQRRYTDVEMAQNWVKDNPQLKPKLRILDDGSVRIILKRGKRLHLKDGVMTNGD